MKKVVIIVAALCIVGGVAAVLVTRGVVRPMREKSNRSETGRNLRKIKEMIDTWAEMHERAYPDRLADLAAAQRLDPDFFICPGSGTDAGAIADADKWTDYVYVSKLKDTDEWKMVQLASPPANHNGKGGFVVFLDGTVEWIDDPVEAAKLAREPWLRAGVDVLAVLRDLTNRIEVVGNVPPEPPPEPVPAE